VTRVAYGTNNARKAFELVPAFEALIRPCVISLASLSGSRVDEL
jgi:hypothetical protein